MINVERTKVRSTYLIYFTQTSYYAKANTCNIVFISLTIGSFTQAETKDAGIKDRVAVDKFITKMVEEHQFDQVELAVLFDSVELQPKIIAAMTRPAEGMPWYKYRKIFIHDSRIQGGVKFWQDNQQSLAAMQQLYGVPEEIIVAIIGVETLYGERTGGHRVIDALATLGFDYPKRSKFFLSELESFLILCREEK